MKSLASLVPVAAAAVIATVALSAAPALAQGADPPPPPADPVGDYRWAVYAACTVAFAAITLFLVLTHLRTRRAAEALSDLERRLDALEGPPPPTKHGT